MSNDSSTGRSGFTVAFFKFFGGLDLGHFLVRSTYNVSETGELSVTLKQGITTCTSKGEKDKLYLKNRGLISLLNVSYKKASVTFANRFRTMLPKLISEDQSRFIAGRFIETKARCNWKFAKKYIWIFCKCIWVIKQKHSGLDFKKLQF